MADNDAGYCLAVAVVAINRFVTDSDAEIDMIRKRCAEQGVEAIDCTHWQNGGGGTEGTTKILTRIV